jgi:hypothetical protein
MAASFRKGVMRSIPVPWSEAGTKPKIPKRFPKTGRGDRRITESGELLLPGAPRTAGIRFCCPVRPKPRLSLETYSPKGVSYAAIASASLSLALMVLIGFTAQSGRAKTSPLNTRRSWFGPVRTSVAAGSGGAAGYCPRVRCVYYATSFITIAGRTRHLPI